ncbi:MAG: phosphotransferase [Parachlamydiaceae bacterium]
MIERQFPSDKCIIDCLSVNYPIKVKTFIPLSGGADVNAATYKVQTPDQSSYFVKLTHGYENHVNATILDLLHGAGIQQIIPPIKTIHGRSILLMGTFCLMLYPFIEGVNGFSHKLTDKQWITLGKALRQIHGFDVPVSLLKQIRQETYSPKWRQTVRSLCSHIQGEPRSNDMISLKFINFMKEHRGVIQRLVDRAEQLCYNIKELSTKFVLCHSDIHGGNVLIRESSNLYIADWDGLIMAPKERDLMFIGGGVANVWNDPQEEISFYKGYGSTDINISILSYYRHERIVEDIAEYGQMLLLTGSDYAQKNRLEMYEQFVSMFDPRGVVDIAFKTDRASPHIN